MERGIIKSYDNLDRALPEAPLTMRPLAQASRRSRLTSRRFPIALD
jgi:hypothetical protein